MANTKTNHQFQMSLPDDWLDQSMFVFNGPEEGGLRHSLTLVIDSDLPDDNLDGFAQERIDAVMNASPGMELLKKEIKMLSNGQEACEAVIKWIPVDGKIIFIKKVYVIIDDTGYSFSANFTKNTIKTIGLDVDRMIGSFRTVSE